MSRPGMPKPFIASPPMPSLDNSSAMALANKVLSSAFVGPSVSNPPEPTNFCTFSNALEFDALKFDQNKVKNMLPVTVFIKYEYKQYLNHYPKECYYGLSGNAFPFEPGSMIIFDNRHIHCTSKMNGIKLGISLRYSV
jgi:hypothetical protein